MCSSAGCCYTEWHSTECIQMHIILLSVFRKNDILLSVLIIFNEGCIVKVILLSVFLVNNIWPNGLVKK